MQARFRKNGDIIILQLLGLIDFGAAGQFRENCFSELVNKKVVFNFEGLQFVGSCGIKDFIDAVAEVYKKSSIPPCLCAVSIEFQKIIETSDMAKVHIYDTELIAIKSFDTPVQNPNTDWNKQNMLLVENRSDILGRSMTEEDIRNLQSTGHKTVPNNYDE